MAPSPGRVLVVAAALAWARLAASADVPAVEDPTLRAAISLVQDGDLERGVIALDTALNRLGRDREADRAPGQVYLGMAYLGLGQPMRARRHLREAWALRAGEPLDPKLFPPRVIALYEENRPAPAPPKRAKASPSRPARQRAGDVATRVIPFAAGVAAGAGTMALIQSEDEAPLPGAGDLTVRIFNCDDHCRVWLNGRLIAEVGLAEDSGRIDIAGRLAPGGANVIAFDVANARGGISYGFEVRMGEAIVFQQLCGVAVRLGCEDDKPFPTGVARRYEYVLAPR